jgi:hypothetical protein
MTIEFNIYLRCLVVPGIILCLLALTSPAYAGKSELFETYRTIKDKLENNVYGIPIYIKSKNENKTMLGEVYGRLPYSFRELRLALATPANWCDIVPQHLNIKACTYQSVNDHCRVTFYTGRKFYETPEDVYQLAYRFKLVTNENKYFHTRFIADKGPLGTKAYLIELEAIPLTDKSSFIHFSYSYQYNFLTELGMDTYLATLGSDKVGFSVTGVDKDGKPIYIDGVRGIIERNSVRYYLAIQSYLQTQSIPARLRFTARISKWFELTEKYHRQLYEMDKKDYLEYKQKEHLDQIRLQAAIEQDDTGQCKLLTPIGQFY